MPGSHKGMKFREILRELRGRARGTGVQTHKRISSVLSKIFCFCKETLWWSSQRGCSALFFPPVLCVLLSLKLNKLLSWQLLLSTWQSLAQPILILASDALCSASSAQLRGSLLRSYCHFSYLPMLSFSPHTEVIGSAVTVGADSAACNHCHQSTLANGAQSHTCVSPAAGREGESNQPLVTCQPKRRWGSLRCPCDAHPLGYDGLSKPSA